MSKIKVAAVVVTYNRKYQLIQCLQALQEQTRTLDTILIIDNCSNDGTESLLFDKGFINALPIENHKNKVQLNSKIPSIVNSIAIEGVPIDIIYLRLPTNTGGAGGFYEGIKLGYELEFDWLWLMDDDGVPDSNALHFLLSNNSQDNFLNSLVLDIEDHDKLSFGLKGINLENPIKTKEQALKFAKNGVIPMQANPFNGTLISRKLISVIGLPKKELFIWGDEVDYQQRATKSKLGVSTIVSAIHYHPKAVAKKLKIANLKFEVTWSGIPFKDYCNIRNTAYIHKKYFPKSVFTTITKYLIFFLMKGDFTSMKLCINATIDGVFERWGKEKKYFKI